MSEHPESCGKPLQDCIDAAHWADEFVRLVVEGGMTTDWGCVVGWFANAIEAGRRHAYAEYRRPVDEEGEPLVAAGDEPKLIVASLDEWDHPPMEPGHRTNSCQYCVEWELKRQTRAFLNRDKGD